MQVLEKVIASIVKVLALNCLKERIAQRTSVIKNEELTMELAMRTTPPSAPLLFRLEIYCTYRHIRDTLDLELVGS